MSLNWISKSNFNEENLTRSIWVNHALLMRKSITSRRERHRAFHTSVNRQNADWNQTNLQSAPTSSLQLRQKWPLQFSGLKDRCLACPTSPSCTNEWPKMTRGPWGNYPSICTMSTIEWLAQTFLSAQSAILITNKLTGSTQWQQLRTKSHSGAITMEDHLLQSSIPKSLLRRRWPSTNCLSSLATSRLTRQRKIENDLGMSLQSTQTVIQAVVMMRM